jgi:xylulokinase
VALAKPVANHRLPITDHHSSMSLLGIDVGTTGCKAAVFSETGRLLAHAYEEYDIQRPQPGWSELASHQVWERVRQTIGKAVAAATGDPVTALSVSSLGEAVVPVTHDREVLGPSILNFDARGAEYLEGLRHTLADEPLYRITGNTLGNHYTVTKLKWIKEHQSELYERADQFLLWGSFVSFMLGAEPAADYPLANRTLLFDVDREGWSDALLAWAGLDGEKLPPAVPSGTVIGAVSRAVAAQLGLPARVAIVAGAHDQCANAVGCGVVSEGRAVYGMGTYLCVTPVFTRRKPPGVMLQLGLNTEHHAVAGQFVSFIYNQGGALLKWFRDTFAAAERQNPDIYASLIAEAHAEPSSVMALPHWSPTGPPHFISDSCGLLAGLKLETTRGDILKGILEGAVFYLRDCLESLPATGIPVTDYRAVGGGSQSDIWVQLSADILGRPFVRPRITQAGVLGAAIIAGAGSGVFPSVAAAAETMVKLKQTFMPDPRRQDLYNARFEKYKRLWPAVGDYLRDLVGG